MSVNCHNSGKIPWNLLSEAFSCQTYDNINFKWKIEKNKLIHFSNVLESLIEDFASTYKKKVKYELNPIEWEYGEETSYGGQISYSDSLLMIYIRLNLILLESKLNKNSRLTNDTWIYDVCSGYADCQPDKYLVNKFLKIRKKLFKKNKPILVSVQNELEFYETRYDVNNLTRELIIEIRNYLKEVFECLIRIYQSEKKNNLESDSIFHTIKWDLE